MREAVCGDTGGIEEGEQACSQARTPQYGQGGFASGRCGGKSVSFLHVVEAGADKLVAGNAVDRGSETASDADEYSGQTKRRSFMSHMCTRGSKL